MPKLSLPEVALEPDHDPLAVHDVAFEEDQVSVYVSHWSRVVAEPEIVTVTCAGAGADGALPPPPPPPQLKIKNTAKRVKRFLIYSIYMKKDYVQKKTIYFYL